jgi:hypothetical protein
MAGIIDVLSNNSDVPFTPDGLRALAQSGTGVERFETPSSGFRVHKLSQRLGSSVVHEIVRRYQSGESATSLAKEHGVAPSALLSVATITNFPNIDVMSGSWPTLIPNSRKYNHRYIRQRSLVDRKPAPMPKTLQDSNRQLTEVGSQDSRCTDEFDVPMPGLSNKQITPVKGDHI